MMVPHEWTRIVGNLAQAITHRSAMRDQGASQQSRDDAVIGYSRTVDAIIDDLSALSNTMVLGRITLFLARKERG